MLKSFFLLRKYYKKHKDRGMPFLSSMDQKVKTMIELAYVIPGEKSIDLGAGDGKVVTAFARKGALAYGVEIDPILAELARHNIRKKRLQQKAKIFEGDLFEINLSPYDIITIYGMPSVLAKLEEKIISEAKNGCRLISNFFQFPNLAPAAEKEDVYLYKIG